MGFLDIRSTECHVLSYIRVHTVNINTEKVGSGGHVNRSLYKTDEEIFKYKTVLDLGRFSILLFAKQRTNGLLA